MNFLTTLWRQATRQKLYTSLVLAGLALGIATFLPLLLIARYEFGWERAYPNVESIYKIETHMKMGADIQPVTASPSPLLPALQNLMPGLIGTRVSTTDATISVDGGKVVSGIASERVSFVDPGFFHVFIIPFEAGDRTTALTRPNGIVISHAMARKYFGHTAPLGHTITITYDKQTRSYIVTGILRTRPATTTIETDFLAAIPDAPAAQPCGVSWFAACVGTYVVLHQPGDVAFLTRSARSAYLASPKVKNSGSFGHDLFNFYPERLTDLRFENGNAADGADRNAVIALAIVGILALCAACLNAINMATAQALARAREVAIRKTLGASRRRLFLRFMGESLTMTAIAALPGLALTEAAIPLLASLTGWPISMDYQAVLPILAGLVLILGLATGLYPALVLSAYQPAAVLGAARLPAQGRMGARLRVGLIGVQFLFAVALGICTLVVNAEGVHLRLMDRGMQTENLLALSEKTGPEIDLHAQALLDWARAQPGVLSATASQGGPFAEPSSTGIAPLGHQEAQFKVEEITIGPNYFQTYGIRLLAGRLPNAFRSADIAPTADSYAANTVLSLSTIHHLGFATPGAAIGQRYESMDRIPLTIIGVVADVVGTSGHEAPHPTSYTLTRQMHAMTIALRAKPGSMVPILDALHRAWPDLAPGVTFAPTLMREQIDLETRADVARGMLFALGSAVAICIACLGLYGLAAFTAERRAHEIGIRKTLGATSRQILSLVVGQFLRPILIASVLAWPIAYLLMRSWLAGFADRVALSPVYFLGMTLGAAALCLATVLRRCLVLARSEPARALRMG